jgi:hypothetical protein
LHPCWNEQGYELWNVEQPSAEPMHRCGVHPRTPSHCDALSEVHGVGVPPQPLPPPVPQKQPGCWKQPISSSPPQDNATPSHDWATVHPSCVAHDVASEQSVATPAQP